MRPLTFAADNRTIRRLQQTIDLATLRP